MATPQKAFIKPYGVFAPSHISGTIERDGPNAYADAIVDISTELDLGGGNDYHLTSSILWGGQVVWTSTSIISGGNITVKQTASLSKARLWEVSPLSPNGQRIEAALYDLETTLVQHGALVDIMQVIQYPRAARKGNRPGVWAIMF